MLFTVSVVLFLFIRWGKKILAVQFSVQRNEGGESNAVVMIDMTLPFQIYVQSLNVGGVFGGDKMRRVEMVHV